VFDRYEALGGVVADLPTAPPPSPVHAQLIATMGELFTLGKAGADSSTPAYLRAALMAFDRSRPMLLEQMQEVPPAKVREFAAGLIVRLQAIVDADDA
jgi:hypothetical protein